MFTEKRIVRETRSVITVAINSIFLFLIRYLDEIIKQEIHIVIIIKIDDIRSSIRL